MFYEIHRKNPVVNLAPMRSYSLHAHKSVELSICIEGQYVVTCNNENKLMRRGDVMIAFPYDIHSYTQKGDAQSVTVIFPPDISGELSNLIEANEYSNFVHNDDAVDFANTMLMWKQQNNNMVLYGYIHVLMGMILELRKNKKAPARITSLDAAIKYISINYKENITLEGVAQKIGVSKEHLSRIFSEKVKGGFHSYVQSIRIEKAKQLLESTDLNISDIMYEAGFNDQRTFNRTFKIFTSATPRRYRNEKTNGNL